MSTCFLLLTAFCTTGAEPDTATAEAIPAPAASDKPTKPPEVGKSTAAPPPAVLFPGSFPERLFDAFKDCKDRWHVPVGLGAWHWEHINNSGPSATGYGIPTIRGTYFWYVTADPEFDLEDGPISKIGGHVEARWREIDKLRPYYSGQLWTEEAYAWFETPIGRFKAGQMLKHFGLEGTGDGSFWATVLFWDGFNFNPDYGLAWEKTWQVRDDLKIDGFAQFFIQNDGIAGALAGAHPESVPGAHQRNTGVVRVVTTQTFADKATLASGLSALVGEVDNISPGDSVVSAWAIDFTYTRGPAKVFGEVMQSYGVLNPTRYVSGGPSDRITDVVLGTEYHYGAVNFRLSYSAGFDEHPSGWQSLLVPGVTVALTKNVDLYAEYVLWDIHHNKNADFIDFENGFQIVLNWRF